MNFLSSRGSAPVLGFNDVLLAGLARDGGLYLPAEWPQLTPETIRSFAGRPYGEVARAAWAIYALMHSRRMPETPPQSALRYGVSYDRTLFDRFGPFRDDIRVAEDTEFNRRIVREAKPAWRPNIVTLHRNPETVWAALADQFVRGRRAAAWSRVDLARSPWQSFRAAPARARRASIVAVCTVYLQNAQRFRKALHHLAIAQRR